MIEEIQRQKARVIDWNLKFPLDKWYRDKHNIGLWTEEHLKLNQIDITYEYLEEVVYREVYEIVKSEKDNKKSGTIIRSNVDEEKLFDEMDY